MKEGEIVTTKKKTGLTRKSKKQLEGLQKMNTIEQEKIDVTTVQKRMDVETNLGDQYLADQNQEYDINDLGRVQGNEEMLIEVLNGMLQKKVLPALIQKINSKNSFQVPMLGINLQNSQIQNQMMWKKVGVMFRIDKEIYNYRTEHLHNQSYKMISELNKQKQFAQKKNAKLMVEQKVSQVQNQQLSLITLSSEMNPGRNTLDLKKDSINIDWSSSKSNINNMPPNAFCCNLIKNDKTEAANRFVKNFSINQKFQLQMEDTDSSSNQEPKYKIITKEDEILIKNNHKYNPKIQLIDEIQKMKKKINKLCKRIGDEQIFDMNSWNYNIVFFDTPTLLRNLPILDQQAQAKGLENQNSINFQTNMMDQELNQIKSNIQKKKKKSMDLAKIQQKQSFLGTGVQVFKDDAQKWMSSTDLRFTNMIFEKQKVEKIQRNPDHVFFDLEQQNFNLLQTVKYEGDFDIQNQFQDYHLMPIGFYCSQDFLTKLSLRSLNYKQEQLVLDLIDQGQQNANDDQGEAIDELKQKQRYKVFMTLADIQKEIYPVLIQEPCPRSMKKFYNRITTTKENFKDLGYKIFFVALCHLASAKGIRMEAVCTDFNEIIDYTMLLPSN